MWHSDLTPAIDKVVEFRDFQEFDFLKHAQITEYPGFHIPSIQAVHFMQSYFKSKVFALKCCGTSTRPVMLLNKQYFFTFFG